MSRGYGVTPGFYPAEEVTGTTQVAVRSTEDNTLLAIYSEPTGTKPLPNPYPVPRDGLVIFYYQPTPNQGTSGNGYYIQYLDDDNNILDTSLGLHGVTHRSVAENYIVLTSGAAIVASGSDDIPLKPLNGYSLSIDGLAWPDIDGEANNILQTDGNGNLSWTANAASIAEDTTPQLGGNLDCNQNNIRFDDGYGFKDDNSNELLIFHQVDDAVNYVNITNATISNGPIIEAKGDDTNIDLNINAKGLGHVVMSGLSYPTSDGTSGQALITDGAGNLSFGVPSSASSNRVAVEGASGSGTISANNLKYHPGLPKAWFSRRTGADDASYGFASTIQSGNHLYLYFETPMATAQYAVVASHAGATANPAVIVNNLTTTYVDIKFRNKTSAQSFLPTSFNIMVFGGYEN